MKKALYVDDDGFIIRCLRRAFGDNNPNIAIAECHTVEEAFQAIDKEKPDVIFLDNDLTRRGNEGLKIADRVKDVKIYSTTGNATDEVLSEYERRGIEIIRKTDFDKIRSILASD